MRLILLWALVGLIGRVRCKCSLAPILDEERPIAAYACTHGDLNDLEELSEEAEWIEFSASRIENIPDNAFQRFKNLRRLSFYNCHVNNISPDAFRGLNRLDWLVLHGTRIYVVRATWFRYLRSLRKLILDRCGIIYVEPDVFHELPLLETLGLRDNDLDCLPIDELEYLRSLKSVRIDGNPWLCECRRNLEKFFDRRSISREEERYTKLPVVRRSIQCMLQLERPILPQYLSPAELEMFERRRLKIPGSKFQTSVLTSLDRLPDSTTRIEISNLRFDRISQYTFFRFGNSLRILDFRDCHLNYIEPDAFAGLHKLERLSLTGNNFVTIGADWFRDLIRLQQLILRGNNIQHIERTAFRPFIDSLRHLDIRDNQLRCISIEDLQELRRLERLDARGNPLTCECREELKRFLTDRTIAYDINEGPCYRTGQEIMRTTEKPQITVATEIPESEKRPGMVHWTTFTETITNETYSNRSILVIDQGRVTPTIQMPTERPTTQEPDISDRRNTCTFHEYIPGTRERIYICSGLQSLEILREIPERAAVIKIFRSELHELRAWSFSRFSRYLRRLELHECGIKRLHPGAFAGLHHLEELSLQGNHLEVITAEHLLELTRLRSLDLSRNRIYRINNDALSMLHLERLDISDNLLNCIGVERINQSMPYLRELRVFNNPWTCLCGTKLANLMRERRIHYDPNTLLNLEEECYTTPTVRPTPTVPTYPNCPACPGVIVQGYNISTILPTTVEGVCTEFQEESGIRYRCSGGNLLLIKSIPNPKRVTAIEFYDGNLPVIPAGIFSEFHNLRELAIRNCGVRNIETGAFNGLHNLRHLTIQDNPLTMIESSWFHLQNLETLDLRGNSLKHIAAGSFRNLPKLTRVNLEGNDLKCIFTSDLNEMPNVHAVDFGGNPLRWRCRVELEQFLEARQIAFVRVEESCEGKKIVRNILYQNRTDVGDEQCSTTCSGSISSPIVSVILACLSLFVMLRPMLEIPCEIQSS